MLCTTHRITFHAPSLLILNMLVRKFPCSQRKHDCGTNDGSINKRLEQLQHLLQQKNGSHQRVSLSVNTDSHTSLTGNKSLHSSVCAPPSASVTAGSLRKGVTLSCAGQHHMDNIGSSGPLSALAESIAGKPPGSNDPGWVGEL